MATRLKRARGARRSEETGVEAPRLVHAFDAFMSPGGVTERISCFTARYAPEDRKGAGGGVDADEHIEVLEMPFAGRAEAHRRAAAYATPRRSRCCTTRAPRA